MHDYRNREVVRRLHEQARVQIAHSLALGYRDADHLRSMIFANVSARCWAQGPVLNSIGDGRPTLQEIDATPDEELLKSPGVGAARVKRFRSHINALRPLLIECDEISVANS